MRSIGVSGLFYSILLFFYIFSLFSSYFFILLSYLSYFSSFIYISAIKFPFYASRPTYIWIIISWGTIEFAFLSNFIFSSLKLSISNLSWKDGAFMLSFSCNDVKSNNYRHIYMFLWLQTYKRV